jgi:hypothetical protein
MAKFLELAVWNANDLIKHRDELKMFLYTHDINVMLISETHTSPRKATSAFPNTHSITLTIQPEPLGAELP